MNKKLLRQKYLDLRKKNPNYDKFFVSNLLKLVDGFSNIALYMKIDNEVNLESLISKLLLTKNIYLPVTNKNLEFRKVSSLNKLGRDQVNIPAPIDGKLIDVNNLDVIIISCVAANYNGYRLGYGGGYYDRILKGYNGLTIGIVYENCLTNNRFEESFDIPLDILVSEKRIIEITKGNNNV